MAQSFKRFVPLADRILVQKLKADVKSAGGIILLPDSAKQEVNQAKVLLGSPYWKPFLLFLGIIPVPLTSINGFQRLLTAPNPPTLRRVGLKSTSTSNPRS